MTKLPLLSLDTRDAASLLSWQLLSNSLVLSSLETNKTTQRPSRACFVSIWTAFSTVMNKEPEKQEIFIIIIISSSSSVYHCTSGRRHVQSDSTRFCLVLPVSSHDMRVPLTFSLHHSHDPLYITYLPIRHLSSPSLLPRPLPFLEFVIIMSSTFVCTLIHLQFSYLLSWFHASISLFLFGHV